MTETKRTYEYDDDNRLISETETTRETAHERMQRAIDEATIFNHQYCLEVAKTFRELNKSYSKKK